jgi:hypothetical protein
MQDVCVVGVELESLLATELRLEISSSRHVVKAGLIKRSRRASDRTVGAYLGFSGCPAVAAIHRYISTWLSL